MKKQELLVLAKKEGVELNEEQLASVSGGVCTATTDSESPERVTKIYGA